jgi:hypothetical protein
MSSVNPTGELTRQLAEFTTKIPDPVATRLRVAADDVTASGSLPASVSASRPRTSLCLTPSVDPSG